MLALSECVCVCVCVRKPFIRLGKKRKKREERKKCQPRCKKSPSLYLIRSKWARACKRKSHGLRGLLLEQLVDPGGQTSRQRRAVTAASSADGLFFCSSAFWTRWTAGCQTSTSSNSSSTSSSSTSCCGCPETFLEVVSRDSIGFTCSARTNCTVALFLELYLTKTSRR